MSVRVAAAVNVVLYDRIAKRLSPTVLADRLERTNHVLGRLMQSLGEPRRLVREFLVPPPPESRETGARGGCNPKGLRRSVVNRIDASTAAVPSSPSESDAIHVELRPERHNPEHEPVDIDLAKDIPHIDGVAVGVLIGQLGSTAS